MNRKLSRPGVREGYDLWSESYDQTPNPLIALDRRFTMTLLSRERPSAFSMPAAAPVRIYA